MGQTARLATKRPEWLRRSPAGRLLRSLLGPPAPGRGDGGWRERRAHGRRRGHGDARGGGGGSSCACGGRRLRLFGAPAQPAPRAPAPVGALLLLRLRRHRRRERGCRDPARHGPSLGNPRVCQRLRGRQPRRGQRADELPDQVPHLSITGSGVPFAREGAVR